MNIDKVEKAFISFCVLFCVASVVLIYANVKHSEIIQEEDLLKYHIDDKELDRCYYYAMSEKK